MTAYTSSQTGNWSAASTWGGVGVPGDGDTVTVLTAHTVTIDVPIVLGNSPASGGYVLTHAGPIVQSAKLTVKGGINCTYSGAAAVRWTMNAGSEVEAIVPAGSEYYWNYNANTTEILINGTAGSPCKVSAQAGGGVFRFNHTSSGINGYLTATYCHFQRIGSASTKMFGTRGFSRLTLTSCVLDACGDIAEDTGPSGGFRKFEQDVWRNTVGARGLAINVSSLAAGNKYARSCYFDKEPQFGCGGLELVDNVFEVGYVATGGPFGPFSGNLVRRLTAAGLNHPGSMLEDYILLDYPTLNPHGVNAMDFAGLVFRRITFEYTGPSTTGDMLGNITGLSAPRIYTADEVLVLPNHGTTQAPGTLLTLGGDANTTWDVFHPTCPTDSGVPGGLSIGETYPGHPGMVRNLKGGLFWAEGSGGGVEERLAIYAQAGAVDDLPTAANVTHNAVPGLRMGSRGLGFNYPGAGAPNAVGAVTAAPNFVDRTRNLRTWDASLGGPGTIANVLLQLRKRYDWTDTGYVAGYTVPTGRDWVRAGFAPQAVEYDGTAHDGGDIGAMPFAGAGGVTGDGAVTLQLTAGGTGAVEVAGSGSTALALTAGGTGAVEIAGLGAASLQLAAGGGGAVAVTGAAAALLALTAAGDGIVTEPGAVVGSGTLLLLLTASGAGAVGVAGDGAARLALLVSGTGTVRALHQYQLLGICRSQPRLTAIASSGPALIAHREN